MSRVLSLLVWKMGRRVASEHVQIAVIANVCKTSRLKSEASTNAPAAVVMAWPGAGWSQLFNILEFGRLFSFVCLLLAFFFFLIRSQNVISAC